MISPLKYLFGPRRDTVASAIESILRAQQWDVQREPIVASMRPDIVARSPAGELYVMEVKQGDADANLGAVAQVESFRNAVTDAWGSNATGVLVVAGTPPPHLHEIASRASVEIVSTESDDLASVQESLDRSGILTTVAAPTDRPVAPHAQGI